MFIVVGGELAQAQYFAGATSSDQIYNIDEYGYAIDSITVALPGYTVFGFNGLDTDDTGQLYALIQTN